MNPALHVVMYHYVRDLPNTPFPRIKGMLIKDFRQQLAALQQCYEMATLESALDVDVLAARRTYRWDTPDVAYFKYVFNFMIDPDIRDQVVKALFEEHIADEAAFSSTLYVSWEEARQMQVAGML